MSDSERTDLEPALSSRGMRRVQYAGGRLHLLWSESGIVIQARTVGAASSAKSATGVAAKVGVEITVSEAADLACELIRAVAAHAAAAGDQREHPNQAGRGSLAAEREQGA